MNYLAHGYTFTERPYFLAGTAVPDWLNVANRKSKAREKRAREWISGQDHETTEIAKGIIQHHQDDARFHQNRTFVELSMAFSVELRERFNSLSQLGPKDSNPPERGFRAGFLGHILVELLLDATLIEDCPQWLEDYYDALHNVDPERVGKIVDQIATAPVPLLPIVIPRFCEERFLADYLEDERLLWRLNHVMRRVKLAELPPEISEFFPSARERVRNCQRDLLGS